jgi:hypothetical protein
MSTETTDTGHLSTTPEAQHAEGNQRTTREHKVSIIEQTEHSEPEQSRSKGTQTSIGASTSNHRAQLSATQKDRE